MIKKKLKHTIKYVLGINGSFSFFIVRFWRRFFGIRF